MKLQVLGNYGGFPAMGENCCGYLIQSKEANVLIECGSGVASEVQKYIQLKDLDAIIISHLHNDHISDLLVLKYAYEVGIKMGSLERIDIFLPMTSKEGILLFDSEAFNIRPLTGQPIRIKDIDIELSPTYHDIRTYAMSFCDGHSKLGYTADTGYKGALSQFFLGCTILLSECSLLMEYKANTPYHLTTDEAVRLAEESNVDTLILTHFWYEIAQEEYLAEANSSRNEMSKLDIDCARRGMEIIM